MSYSTFEVGTILLRAEASTYRRAAKTPLVSETRVSTSVPGHPAGYVVTRMERGRATNAERKQKADGRKQ
jgi:hypothetical protein